MDLFNINATSDTTGMILDLLNSESNKKEVTGLQVASWPDRAADVERNSEHLIRSLTGSTSAQVRPTTTIHFGATFACLGLFAINVSLRLSCTTRTWGSAGAVRAFKATFHFRRRSRCACWNTASRTIVWMRSWEWLLPLSERVRPAFVKPWWTTLKASNYAPQMMRTWNISSLTQRRVVFRVCLDLLIAQNGGGKHARRPGKGSMAWWRRCRRWRYNASQTIRYRSASSSIPLRVSRQLKWGRCRWSASSYCTTWSLRGGSRTQWTRKNFQRALSCVPIDSKGGEGW